MNRKFLFAVIGLAASAGLGACASFPGRPAAGVPLYPDLGNHHLSITTESALAQRYFDQGLRLTWAFNHAEAIAAYEEAARLDPGCALCYWGVAYALGPNINVPMEPAQETAAMEAVQKALNRTQSVSPREQALILALAKRYGEPAGEERAGRDGAYADAMREVVARFPDDPEVGALYADALMNLSPWDYWTKEGHPKGRTTELVATLERAIATNPNHPGACHLYIHAVEASTRPERAVACAERLAGLMPGAGHLVHMPAHIYMRVGRYNDAVASNVHAVIVDEHYIEGRKPEGVYPMLYYPHNLHFLWAAASMEGRSAEAIRAARKLAEKAPAELVREVPPLEFFSPTPYFSLARFGRWDEVLAEPAPPEDLAYTTGMWHYVRGLAFAAKGRFFEAERELAAVTAAAAAAPEGQVVGINKAKSLLRIAENILAGELAARRGKIHEAVPFYHEAMKMEEGLTYDEPPPWYQPVRQFLGAALLTAGRAAEAEAVYREDLARNPENGWSLFGLMESLRLRAADADAAEVKRRFEAAWIRADITIPSSRFRPKRARPGRTGNL